MSDLKDGAAVVPGPSVVADLTEAEADRRKAKKRHWKTYRNQLLGWGAVIILAAACGSIQRLYQLLDFEACHNLKFMSSACTAIHWTSVVAPAVILFGIFFWNRYYSFLRLQDWQVAIGNAQQTINPRNVTKGYTDLFNLYMRTKRRSYLLGAVGLLTLVFGGVGLIVNLGEIASVWYWLFQGIMVVPGLLLVWLGYKIGSSYLPGDVIVRHMLELSIYAISDVTNVDDARRQAQKDAEQFVRDYPWWFYPG